MEFGGGETYFVSYSKEGELDVKQLSVPLVKITNSICFTVDGKFLYHCDSPTKLLNVFPYHADGTLGESKLFYTDSDN